MLSLLIDKCSTPTGGRSAFVYLFLGLALTQATTARLVSFKFPRAFALATPGSFPSDKAQSLSSSFMALLKYHFTLADPSL